MELEPIIGLEIHVQLKTDSKMFCSCPNIFGDVEPNSAICPICLGYPGTLPVPNEKAITWVQKAGAALNCELALESKFDRKHYFYPDLPKGYQISQFDQPFCGKGEVVISVDGELHKVGITRIHLEEDAAKNTHPEEANYTLVDYNRAGTPLIEIVTEPDIKTPAQAKVFLQELQRIMRSLDISDADMEKGQLRCDANISLRKKGETELNPKTEVKNLNSFRNVERALEHEIKRQTKEWEEGNVPNHATRGFNADKGTTYEQRTKEEAADYRYFPEPDIPPLSFTEKEIQEIYSSIPELPSQKRTRFEQQYNLTTDQAQLLLDNQDLAYFFEDTVSEIKQIDKEQVDVTEKEVPELVDMAMKMMLHHVRNIMVDNNLAYKDLKISPNNFAEVIILIQQGKMSKNAAPQVLEEMQKTGGEPEAILKNLGLEQVTDSSDIERYVDEVIQENTDVVEKIKSGKDGAIQFLMGQVMAKSKGAASPEVVIDLLKKKING